MGEWRGFHKSKGLKKLRAVYSGSACWTCNSDPLISRSVLGAGIFMSLNSLIYRYCVSKLCQLLWQSSLKKATTGVIDWLCGDKGLVGLRKERFNLSYCLLTLHLIECLPTLLKYLAVAVLFTILMEEEITTFMQWKSKKRKTEEVEFVIWLISFFHFV